MYRTTQKIIYYKFFFNLDLRALSLGQQTTAARALLGQLKMVVWWSLLCIIRNAGYQMHRQLNAVHHQVCGIHAQHKGCLFVGTGILLYVPELVACVADHEVVVLRARILHTLGYDPLLVEH